MRTTFRYLKLFLLVSLIAACSTSPKVEALPKNSRIAVVNTLDNTVVYQRIGLHELNKKTRVVKAPHLDVKKEVSAGLTKALTKNGHRIVAYKGPKFWLHSQDNARVKAALAKQQLDALLLVRKADVALYADPALNPHGYGFTQQIFQNNRYTQLHTGLKLTLYQRSSGMGFTRKAQALKKVDDYVFVIDKDSMISLRDLNGWAPKKSRLVALKLLRSLIKTL